VSVRFLPPAEAELAEAVAYYNGQSAGLGAELASEIREGLARIEQFPQAWQLLSRRARRYRLRRFPYGLVYVEVGSEIVVLAVMHLHRRPEYWKERLGQV
jgi:plasmid stabilization system protein ParE